MITAFTLAAIGAFLAFVAFGITSRRPETYLAGLEAQFALDSKNTPTRSGIPTGT